MLLKKLQAILEFGTENAGAFTYIGMNVKQYHDKSITLDQLTFTSSPIVLSLDHMMSKAEPLTHEEPTQYWGATGQLNWLATISHPELIFEVCNASSKTKDATVVDTISINKVIYKVK